MAMRVVDRAPVAREGRTDGNGSHFLCTAGPTAALGTNRGGTNRGGWESFLLLHLHVNSASMPRRARSFCGGLTYHVLNRGNARATLFGGGKNGDAIRFARSHSICGYAPRA